MSWLLRPVEDEIEAVRAASRDAVERAAVRANVSRAAAEHVSQTHAAFPWLNAQVAVALARVNARREVVEMVARSAAAARSEGPRQSGRAKRSLWSRVGDVVTFVPREGADFVSNVADTVTPESVEDAVGAAVGGAGDALQSATRYGFAALQTAPETADWAVRDVASTVSEKGWGALLRGETSGHGVEAEDFTLGAHVKGADMGSGFFPSGEAAEVQAARAREFGTIGGSALTVGRLAANAIFEPGSKPYTLMSGLIDAGTEFYSPENVAMSAASKARRARKAFADDVTEAAVEKAAGKAPAAWRGLVEEAAGMVNGAVRNTVVPAAVDKWLFSAEARKVVEKLAAMSSPTAIWRALGKKADPDVVFALSKAEDEAGVLAALRPALGLDVARPTVGRFSDQLGPLGVRVTNTVQRKVRAFNLRPETYLDWEDPAAAIRNLDNSLANAHVMGADRDRIVDEAFDLLNRNDPAARAELVALAKTATKKSLVGYGVDPVMAERLTAWDGGWGRVSKFTDDDLGNDVNLSFLVDEQGVPINRPLPSALVELLSRGVPIYGQKDVRLVRDLTTRLRKVEQAAGFKAPHSAVNFVQQEIWKPSAIMRAAYFARVNTEEVLRSWVSGSFDSVVDWIRFAANRTGTKDASGNFFNLVKEGDRLTARLRELTDESIDVDELGRIDKTPSPAVKAEIDEIKARLAHINDELVDDANEFHRSQVGRYWNHDSVDAVERQLHRTGSWQTADRDLQPEAWAAGVADSVIAFSKDPILRRVANGGLFDGDKAANARDGLDGIKDWLTNGTGVKFRQRLERAFEHAAGRPIDLTDEAHLGALIEHYVSKLQWKVGDERDLWDAVASGTFAGKPIAVKAKSAAKGRAGHHDASAELKARVLEWRSNPSAPQKVKFEQRLAVSDAMGGRAAGEFFEHRDALVNWFFGNLYGRTSDWLARSPVFRAKYWTRMEQLMPWMDDTSRRQAVANARAQKLGKSRLARLDEMLKRPAGELSLDDADLHAKGYGLDETKKTFYDASEASQFFDIYRAVFPFGEAWREVLTRWAKTLAQQPAVANRGAQTIQGARESGFFYRDPVTGEEVFNYLVPPFMADYLGVEWKGSALGLSLGTQLIPGLSPVASIGLSQLVPDVPEADWIAGLLFPFGEPDATSPGSLVEQFVPPWAKKGFEAWSASEEKNRIYGNTYVETVRVLISSGDYGASVEERDRLFRDARDRARAITGIRALLQFVVPSAPSPNYLVETDDGDKVAGLLVKRFGELLEDNEYPDAIEKFIGEFGDQAFAYLAGKTKPTVGGLSPSKTFGEWERRNGSLFEKYPKVAGYFGPTDEGYDPAVFSRQERTGKRKRQTARELVADAESTVARWIWNQKKAEVGPKPSKAQKEWLARVRADLREDYPGWNPDAYPAGERNEAIRQLEDAVDDAKVRGTTVGQALAIYFRKRGEAFEAARSQWGYSTGHLSGKKARRLREWMRQIASDLAEDYPGFARVFDEVLDGEMRDDAALDAADEEIAA